MDDARDREAIVKQLRIEEIVDWDVFMSWDEMSNNTTQSRIEIALKVMHLSSQPFYNLIWWISSTKQPSTNLTCGRNI